MLLPSTIPPNRRARFFQTAKHDFSKSPNTIPPNRRARFLQIVEHDFSKSPSTISPNRQARSLQFAKHDISNSPNTLTPNHRTRFFQKSPTMFPPGRVGFPTKTTTVLHFQFPQHSPPIVKQHTFFPSVFYGNDPVPDYILHMLRGSALCVTVGRLWFLGHACSSYTCQGLGARCYGPWASQGLAFRNELTARTPL